MVSPQVIGLGAMNMDYFYRVKSLLKDGEARVEEVHSFSGGSAANTIYGLAKLGIACGFVGAIGSDEVGQHLIEDLKGVGVDTGFIITKAASKTGSVVALVDIEAHRALYVHQGANGSLTKADMDLSYLSSAQIVHASAFVGEQQFLWQRDILSSLPLDTKLSFSPGALYSRRGLENLKPILEKTSILFLNRKELKELTGSDPLTGALRCIQAGCQTVVVTMGKGLRRGNKTFSSLVVQPNKVTWVPVTGGAKHPVDTTGAGDAFASGFLFGHLMQKPAEECAILGDITAGFSITCVGARTGLPGKPELANAYQQATGLIL